MFTELYFVQSLVMFVGESLKICYLCCISFKLFLVL